MEIIVDRPYCRNLRENLELGRIHWIGSSPPYGYPKPAGPSER